MGVWARAARDLRYLRGLTRTLSRVRGVGLQSTTLACDDIEAAVDRFAQRTAIVFEGRSVTYAEFDEMANRFAHWATGRNIRRGQVVALFIPSRTEYPAIWYGLSKVGVITALINSQLTGPALIHALTISGAAHIVTDTETTSAFASVRSSLARPMTEWTIGGAGHGKDRSLDQTLKGVSSLRPTRDSVRGGLTGKDVVLYIYTSGTTGLPKAAKVSHVKAQVCMRGFAAGTNAKPGDRIYNTLPLYHSTGGLCALGAALLSGATMVLKPRFSAGQFWEDVVREECTMFVYIGEICRYLVNQPPQPGEAEHRIRVAFGNGLRAEVAQHMDQRFKIPMILEFYGSTEGNVSLLNFDGKLGAVGRVPKYLRGKFNVRIARFDVDRGEPERNMSGRLIECAPGEVGEMLGRITDQPRAAFAGYADRKDTESKILRDAFEKGDAWFRTGDLMRQDQDGYLYFVDRIGDTYRWKGENVSTNEVEACLSLVPGVQEANVYGVSVPGTEGRAGMAALVTTDAFELKTFQSTVEAGLPPYAQPVFLRLQPQLQTTATFKHRKTELAAEGFDPAKIRDPLFYRAAGKNYARLYAAAYRKVCAGEIRL